MHTLRDPGQRRHARERDPSVTGEEEGEEPEDPDGTDAGTHREDPERAPVRAPTPEVAAIAEDTGELEVRVPEVEDTEKPEEQHRRNPLTFRKPQALREKSSKTWKKPISTLSEKP